MTEPQLGGTYDDLLAAARWAESAGMTTFARSDHYWWDETASATDAFATLAGLARDTVSIRLAVLVSPVTFRHPAVIGKNAVTIDEMSGGRLDLGVGTGWHVAEHEAMGLPFPDTDQRFERLEDTLGYLRAMFGGRTFHGTHHELTRVSRPQPGGIRLIVGGSGSRRTPRLAGRAADGYNITGVAADGIPDRVEVMRRAAEESGRDPDAIVVSVMSEAMVGFDQADLIDRVGAEAARRGVEPESLMAELRDVPLGTVEQAAATFAAWSAAGVSRFYFQWFDVTDLDRLRSAWEPVVAALSA